MACLARSFMAAISAVVALRSLSPMTCWRMLPCPTSMPKLTLKRVAASLSRKGFSGRGELPSGPSISVVTPWRIWFSPAAENQIRQGVTTLIEGPDGSSPLPLKPFLDKLAATQISVNFGTLVGQGSIREKVIGLKDRKATPEELGAMRELTRQAMLDGAFGLSTGLFYLPGAFTPTEEVIEIAKVAGAMGGIHTSHMRDEAAAVLNSVQETIRIGEEGRLPTQLTHHKIIGRSNWGRSVETSRLVEEARARGVDVTIDQYPYTASSTGTGALFPQWSLESGQQALIERLGAADQRARIVAALADRTENHR